MSDIFISYATNDRERVELLAQVLEAQGWSVFWDPVILPGQDWRTVIEEALDAARCVVVVWTKASVKSKWVLEEAGEGSERGILVPVKMEEARIPLGFRSTQAERLLDWQGDGQHQGIGKLNAAVGRLIGKPNEKSLLPTFTNVLGIEFLLVEAGSFLMGSTEGQDSLQPVHSMHVREWPVHEVTLSKPIYMSKYETTQGQWIAVMESNPSFFTEDDNCPIEQVSWDDVQEFIRRLNEQEACENCYRLPTEAEWEYVARAGARERYDGDLHAMAWYRGNAGGKTHPVGQKTPNAWGFYDMRGNVWEWVADWYGEYYPEGVTDPQGPKTGSKRVIRGGSYINIPRSVQWAPRDMATPGNTRRFIGFRLVRDGQ